MTLEKENFLRSKLVPALQKAAPSTPPRWGKMTLHHMVEHLADVMKVASGRLVMEIVTPAERLPLYREFLMSDKPFRENTRSPVLPEEPLPLRTRTLQAAIGKLQEEIIYFFEVFEQTPGLSTTHPVFGKLDFNENVQCVYKHALHHLQQFGIGSPFI